MGIITALSATGLAAGLAVTGVSAASASGGDITLPAGSVLAQQVTKYCSRTPALITRAQKAQTRLSGDADTKGSIAWLKAREAKAGSKGHPKVAAALAKRITRRSERLAELPAIQTRLTQAKGGCTDLGLGTTPLSTPSTSTGS